MTVILENEHIRVGINEHGAELSELVLKKTGANYLWSGDAKYWGRHAPVLFPTVGKLKNDEYFIDGKSCFRFKIRFGDQKNLSVRICFKDCLYVV